MHGICLGNDTGWYELINVQNAESDLLLWCDGSLSFSLHLSDVISTNRLPMQRRFMERAIEGESIEDQCNTLLNKMRAKILHIPS